MARGDHRWTREPWWVWNCGPTGCPARSPPRSAGWYACKRLDLGDNDIYGDIPAEIGDLLNLTHLDLQNNRLDRQIPPEVGNLSEPGAPRPQVQRVVGGYAR